MFIILRQMSLHFASKYYGTGPPFASLVSVVSLNAVLASLVARLLESNQFGF